MASSNNDPRMVTAMCDACRRDSEIYCFFSFPFVLLL